MYSTKWSHNWRNMKVLLGIIFLHLLVIIRAKQPDGAEVPYLTIFLITLAIVLYVVYMMFSMDVPES